MDEKMDLRIRKTYTALQNAFNALLEEKCFEDLTVNELCERAMIRRTTFYKHFADKYEYFTFYIREIMETFQEHRTHDVCEETIDAYLVHMCRETLRFVREHNRLVQSIKASSVFPILLNIMIEQIAQDLGQVLQSNKESQLNKTQIDGIAAFYAGGIANALFRYLKRDLPINEDQFIEIIAQFRIDN